MGLEGVAEGEGRMQVRPPPVVRSDAEKAVEEMEAAAAAPEPPNKHEPCRHAVQQGVKVRQFGLVDGTVVLLKLVLVTEGNLDGCDVEGVAEVAHGR